MKTSLIKLALSLSLLTLPALALSPTVSVGGQNMEILINAPEQGQAPYPLLVIAPAKKYTMQGDLFKKLAQKAAGLGYYVVRFNWHFVTDKSNPSGGLTQESEQLKQVIAHYQKHPWVKVGEVVLAAKSFGSRVAMKGAYTQAHALLMLTPNCSEKAPFEEVYAPLLTTKKPVQIVISTEDPYCPIGQIYKGLGTAGSQLSVYTLAGDHNFGFKNKAHALNVESALNAAESWLELQL